MYVCMYVCIDLSIYLAINQSVYVSIYLSTLSARPPLPFPRPSQGKTPLYYTYLAGQREAGTLLLMHGACRDDGPVALAYDLNGERAGCVNTERAGCGVRPCRPPPSAYRARLSRIGFFIKSRAAEKPRNRREPNLAGRTRCRGASI